MSVDSAWLLLGGPHHLNGLAPVSDTDPVVIIPLGDGRNVRFPQNTVVLTWAELGQVELRGKIAGRSVLARGAGSDLFPDMMPGPDLVELVGDGPGPLVPLFHLAVRNTPAGPRADVHAQIRFTAEDACFIRITPEPIAVSDVMDLGWLPEAVRLHAAQALFLNNHQCYYRKCFPEQENE